MLDASRDEGGALKDSLGAMEIGVVSSLPSFSDTTIEDAQAIETHHGEEVYEVDDLFDGYFAEVEDITGLGDLDVPRKKLNEFFLQL